VKLRVKVDTVRIKIIRWRVLIFDWVDIPLIVQINPACVLIPFLKSRLTVKDDREHKLDEIS
jgi:hypothetical protein